MRRLARARSAISGSRPRVASSCICRDSGRQDYLEQARQRYVLEPYIEKFADFAACGGKRVLEIGVGLGADHQGFALAGARLSGIDLTERAVALTRRRLALFGLQSELAVGDAENLSYARRRVRSGVFLGRHPSQPQHTARSGGDSPRPAPGRNRAGHDLPQVESGRLHAVGTLCAGAPAAVDDAERSLFARTWRVPAPRPTACRRRSACLRVSRRVRTQVVLTHGDLLESAAGQRHRGMLLTLARRMWPATLLRRIARRPGAVHAHRSGQVSDQSRALPMHELNDAHAGSLLMRQVLQSLSDGSTTLAEVPTPAVPRGGLLIRTTRSLISAGTERMLVEFGRCRLAGEGPAAAGQGAPGARQDAHRRAAGGRGGRAQPSSTSRSARLLQRRRGRRRGRGRARLCPRRSGRIQRAARRVGGRAAQPVRAHARGGGGRRGGVRGRRRRRAAGSASRRADARGELCRHRARADRAADRAAAAGQRLPGSRHRSGPAQTRAGAAASAPTWSRSSAARRCWRSPMRSLTGAEWMGC